MAITIRNKETEELIRKIGRRTGEGPSAVVFRLVQNEVNQAHRSSVPEEEVQRRIAEMHALRDRYTHPDDPKLTWAEIEREMDSIFGDDLDLPPKDTSKAS